MKKLVISILLASPFFISCDNNTESAYDYYTRQANYYDAQVHSARANLQYGSDNNEVDVDASYLLGTRVTKGQMRMNDVDKFSQYAKEFRQKAEKAREEENQSFLSRLFK